MNGYTKGCIRKNTSSSTQRIDFSLRAVKIYGNAESRAERKEHSWEATNGNAKGCNQEGTSARSGQTLIWRLWRWTTTLKVVLREHKVMTHSRHPPIGGLWRQSACRELYRARKGILICNRKLCRWLSWRQLQHIADRLWSEGYEDRQHHWELCWSKNEP